MRTKARDLKREKRRAEGLVYQMLPRFSHLVMDLSNFKQFAETNEAHSHDPRTIRD